MLSVVYNLPTLSFPDDPTVRKVNHWQFVERAIHYTLPRNDLSPNRMKPELLGEDRNVVTAIVATTHVISYLGTRLKSLSL